MSARQILMALVCLSTGCSTVSSFEYKPETKLPAGEGLVCGRIRVQVQNRKMLFGKAKLMRDEMLVFVVREGSTKRRPYPVRNEEDFCWHLPPGHYRIADFQRWFGDQVTAGELSLGFDVPAAGAKRCIGTLILELNYGIYKFSILDQCDPAEDKQLMALERPKR